MQLDEDEGSDADSDFGGGGEGEPALPLPPAQEMQKVSPWFLPLLRLCGLLLLVLQAQLPATDSPT